MFLEATHPPQGRDAPFGAGAVDAELLARLLDHIEQKAPGIDSILVTRGRDVLFDCTFAPWPTGGLHPIYSCTKTILGVLIGIAIDKQLIGGVDESVYRLLRPERCGDLGPEREALTIGHLLTMTSGLAAQDYGGSFNGYFQMLSRRDLVEQTLDLPMRSAPGSEFHYNNAGSHLLACILRNATGISVLDFAREHLFGPLGIEEFTWDQNPQAGVTGWSGLSLSPRDLAKVGQLYLDGGLWGHRRIVSTGWVEASTRGYAEAKPHGRYGYHWWVEPDLFMGVGHFGQYLIAVPESDLVIVINSSLQPGEMLLPKYLARTYLLPAFATRSQGPDDAFALAEVRTLMARARLPKAANRFVWHDEPRGVAQDGLFERTAFPAFRFRYPPRSARANLTSPSQVAAITTFESYPLYAFINDVPPGASLEGAGAIYAAALRTFGKAERFEVRSNKPFHLSDGTPAYRTDIRYRFEGSLTINAVVVSAFRQGKWICIEGHTPGDPTEIATIAESMTFDV